jgi:hypothetical protein
VGAVPAARLRGQWASRNLDSYNQITLTASAINRDALQGAGLQLQGRYFQLHCTLTWAKALGGDEAWVPGHIGFHPGNSRVNLSVIDLF